MESSKNHEFSSRFTGIGRSFFWSWEIKSRTWGESRDSKSAFSKSRNSLVVNRRPGLRARMHSRAKGPAAMAFPRRPVREISLTQVPRDRTKTSNAALFTISLTSCGKLPLRPAKSSD